MIPEKKSAGLPNVRGDPRGGEFLFPPYRHDLVAAARWLPPCPQSIAERFIEFDLNGAVRDPVATEHGVHRSLTRFALARASDGHFAPADRRLRFALECRLRPARSA